MVDFKTCTIDDIIDWCQENNQVDWLKKEAAKIVDYKVYPKVSYIDENGEKKTKADKTQQPQIEKRPISFIQLKIAFYEKFFPDMKPQSKAKETMFDRIMAL